MDKSIQLYCEHMEVIKLRVSFIDDIVHQRITCGRDEFNWEIVALNFRKILELIAYSSLIANKEKYSEAHKNFAQHYKAHRILEAIEKINPEFYPKPHSFTLKDGHVHFEPIKSGYLTKQEFERLYDTCSGIVHQWNPYKPIPKDEGTSPVEWLKKIGKLLDTHFMRLVDTEEFWIIQMNGKEKVLWAKAGPKIDSAAA